MSFKEIGQILIREKNKSGWNIILGFLSARKQSCLVDGHLSSDISLFYCGVPQGSIGAPLLWVCFTVTSQMGFMITQLMDKIWMNRKQAGYQPWQDMGTKRMAATRREVSIQARIFKISPIESETLLVGKLHQSMQWNQHISDGESSLQRQLPTRINGLKKNSVNATFLTRLMVANGAVMSKIYIYLSITIYRI